MASPILWLVSLLRRFRDGVHALLLRDLDTAVRLFRQWLSRAPLTYGRGNAFCGIYHQTQPVDLSCIACSAIPHWTHKSNSSPDISNRGAGPSQTFASPVAPHVVSITTNALGVRQQHSTRRRSPSPHSRTHHPESIQNTSMMPSHHAFVQAREEQSSSYRDSRRVSSHAPSRYFGATPITTQTSGSMSPSPSSSSPPSPSQTRRDTPTQSRSPAQTPIEVLPPSGSFLTIPRSDRELLRPWTETSSSPHPNASDVANSMSSSLDSFAAELAVPSSSETIGPESGDPVTPSIRVSGSSWSTLAYRTLQPFHPEQTYRYDILSYMLVIVL